LIKVKNVFGFVCVFTSSIVIPYEFIVVEVIINSFSKVVKSLTTTVEQNIIVLLYVTTVGKTPLFLSYSFSLR